MTYRLNPHQKRLPIGGHHFYQGDIMLKGETFDDVLDLLENFRLVNGIPLGNPRQEILDYYAEKFPWMVQPDFSAKPGESLNEDYVAWRSWIASLWGQPAGKFLSKKEASMRLVTCDGCPHNVGTTWKESKESIEFQRKALMLRHGHSAPMGMCYCNLHRADISVSSFLDKPHELSRKPKDKPDHEGCWFNISREP